MRPPTVARRRGGGIPAAIWAGLVYFLLLFVASLGIYLARVFILAPMIGPALAWLLGLPVMLVIAWMASRNVIDRMAPARHRPSAALMGAIALLSLLIGDLGLSLLNGQTVAAHFAGYLGLPGLLEPLAILACGIIPFVQVSMAERRPR